MNAAKQKLGLQLGKELQTMAETALLKEGMKSDEFFERMSKLLIELGYANCNPVSTVRAFRRIYSGKGLFSIGQFVCVEYILKTSVPDQIRNMFEGPLKIISGPSAVQARLAERLEAGQIKLNLTADEYFSKFFEFVRAGQTIKKVRVFARMLNLVARKNLHRFGPQSFFPACRELVAEKHLDMEYILCFYSPDSLKTDEVKGILLEYKSFASQLHLHFETDSSFPDSSISQTISIWDEYCVYTHGWDHDGKMLNLVKWPTDEQRKYFLQLFNTIQSKSKKLK